MCIRDSNCSVDWPCSKVPSAVTVSRSAARSPSSAPNTSTNSAPVSYTHLDVYKRQVKGWAVDLAGDELRGLPGVSWCINAGGDVRAGRHQHVPPTGEDAKAWRIGIENPYDRSQIARVVPLTDGAVATSGTAARGAHLYDPHTRQAVGRPGSTSVVGPDLLLSLIHI